MPAKNMNTDILSMAESCRFTLLWILLMSFIYSRPVSIAESRFYTSTPLSFFKSFTLNESVIYSHRKWCEVKKKGWVEFNVNADEQQNYYPDVLELFVPGRSSWAGVFPVNKPALK